MADEGSALVCDEAQLFDRYGERLWLQVRAQVPGPDAVIDAACERTWARLLRNSREVDRTTVFPWLRTVALREAAHTAERERQEAFLARSSPDAREGTRAATVEHGRRAGELGQDRDPSSLSFDEVHQLAGEACETLARHLERGRERLWELVPELGPREQERERSGERGREAERDLGLDIEL